MLTLSTCAWWNMEFLMEGHNYLASLLAKNQHFRKELLYFAFKMTICQNVPESDFQSQFQGSFWFLKNYFMRTFFISFIPLETLYILKLCQIFVITKKIFSLIMLIFSPVFSFLILTQFWRISITEMTLIDIPS